MQEKRPWYKKPELQILLILLVVLGLRFLKPSNLHNITGLEKVHVERVIDGDTIIVDKEDGARLRLIGIDTPESVNPYQPELNCEEGEIVSQYVKDLIEDKDVYLEYDHKYKDRFSRILAYVYLDEKGEHMLQMDLLEKGYARLMILKPNTRYKQKFIDTAQKAKDNQVGFWSHEIFQTTNPTE